MTQEFNCACVIHGQKYSWQYVDNLYRMLCRHISAPIKLHVFTEANRSVPNHMIKHTLKEWPDVSNTRQAWWYKMQMFDPAHNLGRLLYLDLDVVVCDSLDWLQTLDHSLFWTINDWRRFWKSNWTGINSSMMYWDTASFPEIWDEFKNTGLKQAVRQFAGDQDFLTKALSPNRVRYFDDAVVRSWRWQIKDGGMDPKTRKYARPDAGSILTPGTAVMVFHGSPKPHEIQDEAIIKLWN